MTVSIEAAAFFDMQEKVGKMHKRLEEAAYKPVYKPVGGSLVVPAGGAAPQLLILQGYPARGRVWNILRYAIYGADTHTTVANVTADFFTGTEPDLAAGFGSDFGSCFASAVPVPQINAFSRWVEWCQTGESVYVVLSGTGVTPGAQFNAVVRVGEYPSDAVEASIV